jgi:hypothetical protein
MSYHQTYAEYRAEMKRRFPYVIRRHDGLYYETGEKVTAEREAAILGDASQSIGAIAGRALQELQK